MPDQILSLQVGVKALLKNKDNKYLFLRRNPEKYPGLGNSWDIVGGRIEPGTPLLENLKREIKEETKLILEKTPHLVAAQDILRPNKHVVRLTFVGEIDGEPVLDQDHIEYKWFSLEELKTLENLDSFFKELLDANKF